MREFTDGFTCPRHGDVNEAVNRYIETGELTSDKCRDAR